MRTISRSKLRVGLILLLMAVLVPSFQNCGSEVRDMELDKALPFEASSTQKEPSKNPLEGVIQADYSTFQNARLKANLFTLYQDKNNYSRYSVTKAPTRGKLQILDHRSGRFIYDPDLSFTGVDEFTYDETLPNGDVRSRSTKIYVVRSSMLGDLKPALAVRAMGCVGCHSNIASNIITDFGAGGDGKRDYSFGKLSVGTKLSGSTSDISINSGNVYFDHASYPGHTGSNGGDGNLSTMNMAPGTQVLLPKGLKFSADMATQQFWMADKNKSDSFVNIVNSILSRPAGTAFDYSPKQYLESINPGLGTRVFPKFSVGELSSVFIGAPTPERIAALRAEAKIVAATNTRPEFVYVKESKTSPDLAKIDIVGDTAYARDGFVCDGDLFVDRKLVLEDMTLITNQGCRIYSPEPVFIQGRVQYESNKPYANLQISSARAIMIGIGKDTCGTTDAEKFDQNSLRRRTREWWTPSMFTRGDLPADGAKSGPEVTEEKLYSDSQALALKDARCIEKEMRAAGKLGATAEIDFERVLWNAPKVETRFKGNISGVIIAEIALLAISNVKYNFNDVFTYVPVLPMLSPSDYLMVID